MVAKDAIAVIASLIMAAGMCMVFYDRWRSGRGIGVRAIQLLAVVFILPTTLILGLEGVLNPEAIATLVGATAGYILSGVGKDE